VSINWFEGGRRITYIFMAIATIIGCIDAYNYHYRAIVLWTSSPGDVWQLNPFDEFDIYQGCGSNAAEKKLSDFEIISGEKRDIFLCFSKNSEGKIIYEISKPSKKLDPYKNFGNIEWSGDESDIKVSNYIQNRYSEFNLDSKMISQIQREIFPAERQNRLNYTKATLLPYAMILGGFWIFSFVIGWIVRGFAGIPRGWDFRTGPKKPADQKMLGGLDDKAI
jgi:hypothetical protein